MKIIVSCVALLISVVGTFKWFIVAGVKRKHDTASGSKEI